MSIPCPLCPDFNVESPPDQQPTGDLVEPGEKARTTLIDFSKGRLDGRDSYLSNTSRLLVHTKCRKEYTRRISLPIGNFASVNPAGDASSTGISQSLRSGIKRGIHLT